MVKQKPASIDFAIAPFIDQTIGGISCALQLIHKPNYLIRYLKDLRGYNMKDNFRPVLPLNRRKLYVTILNYNASDHMPEVYKRER